jgi:lysyl-tRNA synthetase class I
MSHIRMEIQCHRCGRVWIEEVPEDDAKIGIAYTECECGKSGKFGCAEPPKEDGHDAH